MTNNKEYLIYNERLDIIGLVVIVGGFKKVKLYVTDESNYLGNMFRVCVSDEWIEIGDL